MRSVKQSRPIGYEEYQRLFKASHNIALKRAMFLLYYGGFRVNEVRSITTKQIESIFEKGELDLFIPKQNIQRVVYFNEKAMSELRTLMSIKVEKYFIHYKGDSLRVIINRLIKDVLGEGYTSHGFRRGLITHVIENTKNPKLAQYLIGHKDIKTTLHYDAPSELLIKEAYNLI